MIRLTAWIRPVLRSAATCIALCAAFVAAAGTVHAQNYFGRNKVNYQTFDFHVMKTEHFDVLFYPEEAEAAADAARMAERWAVRHQRELQHPLSARRSIVLYANHPDFQQTNVGGGGLIDESTGGFTEGLRDRVVLPLTGVYADNDHVIGHELVHVWQYNIAEGPTANGLQALERLPLWLIEGMAEYLSLGREDELTAMWMRDGVIHNDIPTIKQLTQSNKYFPYRWGQALWAYIGGKWGDEMVGRMYRSSLSLGFEGAIRRNLGMSSDSLSKEWAASTRATFGSLVAGRTTPQQLGERVLAGPVKYGDLNVSPELSPDGKYVAFYGARNLFGLDLSIADAHTGQVVKTLIGPGGDSHFDALSFLYSAGAWSPDGKRLAFVVFAKGDNEIEIYDLDKGGITQTIHPANVGAIATTSWSPDGRQLIFSGTAGGISDLYLYTFADGGMRRLTNDKYADLQPTWSPDGKSIAFVTDRGAGTDFQRLTYSPMRIAIMDVASGNIRLLPLFDGVKHINPRYSPDGKDLYFVAAREGFSDLYRVALESGEIFQLTRLATGASGVTALSPVFSVATQTGRILYTVFDNGGNRVYALEGDQTRGAKLDASATATAGQTQVGPTAAPTVNSASGGTTPNAAVLPPQEARGRGSVTAYLRDPDTGLAQNAQNFAVVPYSPHLSLEYLGQPSLGVSFGGGFGTLVAGSASAFFGDVLDDRQLGVAVQSGGTVKDIGAQVQYFNSKNRLAWGVGGGRVPYLTGFTALADENSPSCPQCFSYNFILERIFFDQVQLVTQYPLSQTKRWEFGAGVTRQSYDLEIDKLVFDQNGQPLTESRNSIPGPRASTYVEPRVAFVSDNSFMGFTSPISGERYRLEATPTFGTFSYQAYLADYRRYFFARPVTFALRAMHYGRYGKNGDDTTTIYPLFLGQPTLVRGYSSQSFTPEECAFVNNGVGVPIGGVGQVSTGCPVFDRLIGSRVGVFNAELRIPLFGSDQLGIFHTSFLPIEIAPFFDAGVAWYGFSHPELTFSETSAKRIPVFSTGISTRFNVLGFVVLEVYYANAFQRPGNSHQWGFQLAPGW